MTNAIADAALPIVMRLKLTKSLREYELQAKYTGKEPSKIPVADLLEMVRLPYNPSDPVEKAFCDNIRDPLSAIQAHCVICIGGNHAEVRHCTAYKCKLFPFREGYDPLNTPTKRK